MQACHRKESERKGLRLQCSSEKVQLSIEELQGRDCSSVASALCWNGSSLVPGPFCHGWEMTAAVHLKVWQLESVHLQQVLFQEDLSSTPPWSSQRGTGQVLSSLWSSFAKWSWCHLHHLVLGALNYTRLSGIEWGMNIIDWPLFSFLLCTRANCGSRGRSRDKAKTQADCISNTCSIQACTYVRIYSPCLELGTARTLIIL